MKERKKKNTTFLDSTYWIFLNKKIMVTALLLFMIGLIMVLTASSYKSIIENGNALHFFIRQLAFMLFGFVILFGLYPFKTSLYRKNSVKIVMELAITALLFIVLIFGKELNGAKGWILLGPFSLQPVEFAKPALILLWADFLTRKQAALRSVGLVQTIKQEPTTLFLFAIWMGVVLLFPDVGGVLLLGTIFLIMTLASGIHSTYFLKWTGTVVGLYAVVTTLLQVFDFSVLNKLSYTIQRFTAFADPFKDAQGTGLQLVNSYYALALGGVLGRGPGNSIEKTGYLPEAYNDFIMSIVGEEFGLVMILVILALYFFLIFYMLYRSQKMRQTYHQLTMIGIASYFLAQALVNLGGVTGLLPITGITFPFISYGGSSVIVTNIMIGLALATIRSDAKLNVKEEEND